MICKCVCGMMFENKCGQKTCPDCGSLHIKEATQKEIWDREQLLIADKDEEYPYKNTMDFQYAWFSLTEKVDKAEGEIIRLINSRKSEDYEKHQLEIKLEVIELIQRYMREIQDEISSRI